MHPGQVNVAGGAIDFVAPVVNRFVDQLLIEAVGQIGSVFIAQAVRFVV